LGGGGQFYAATAPCNIQGYTVDVHSRHITGYNERKMSVQKLEYSTQPPLC